MPAQRRQEGGEREGGMEGASVHLEDGFGELIKWELDIGLGLLRGLCAQGSTDRTRPGQN